MVEVLAVIILIAILAALAAPSFVNLMRDRRVNRAAQEAAAIVRLARTSALKSEAANVRWTAAGGQAGMGMLSVREAVIASAGAPIPTCNGTDWTDSSTASRLVATFEPGSRKNPSDPSSGDYGYAAVELLDRDGAVRPYAEICFTGRGKAFIRYAHNATFEALKGVPRITVNNTRTTFLRTVFIPPNGAARLAL